MPSSEASCQASLPEGCVGRSSSPWSGMTSRPSSRSTSAAPCLPSAELARPRGRPGRVALGHAQDGLGVVRPAVLPEHVVARRGRSRTAQERVGAELVALIDGLSNVIPGYCVEHDHASTVLPSQLSVLADRENLSSYPCTRPASVSACPPEVAASHSHGVTDPSRTLRPPELVAYGEPQLLQLPQRAGRVVERPLLTVLGRQLGQPRRLGRQVVQRLLAPHRPRRPDARDRLARVRRAAPPVGPVGSGQTRRR